MDCPLGFTLKRKRTEKNSGTSASTMAVGFHMKIKAGGTELRSTYPVAQPNVVPPIIRNVTRKDLAVPAVHSMLSRSGSKNVTRKNLPSPAVLSMLCCSGSRNMPHRDVKKEVPDKPESSGMNSPSPAVPLPADP